MIVVLGEAYDYNDNSVKFVILFPDVKGAESIQLKYLFPHTCSQKKISFL